MSKQALKFDMSGKPIYIGDTVKDECGNEFVIEFDTHRELFGGGNVYGYYIPDYCIKIEADKKPLLNSEQ